MSKKSMKFNIDEKLIVEADIVLEEIGLSMSSALTMFLKQVVNKRKIPFELETEDSFYTVENQQLIADRMTKFKAKRLREHGLININDK